MNQSESEGSVLKIESSEPGPVGAHSVGSISPQFVDSFHRDQSSSISIVQSPGQNVFTRKSHSRPRTPIYRFIKVQPAVIVTECCHSGISRLTDVPKVEPDEIVAASESCGYVGQPASLKVFQLLTQKSEFSVNSSALGVVNNVEESTGHVPISLRDRIPHVDSKPCARNCTERPVPSYRTTVTEMPKRVLKQDAISVQDKASDYEKVGRKTVPATDPPQKLTYPMISPEEFERKDAPSTRINVLPSTATNVKEIMSGRPELTILPFHASEQSYSTKTQNSMGRQEKQFQCEAGIDGNRLPPSELRATDVRESESAVNKLLCAASNLVNTRLSQNTVSPTIPPT